MKTKQFLQEKYRKLQLFLGHINKKSLTKILLWASILVVLSFVVAKFIWEEQMQVWVEKAGIWWPLVIIALKALTVFVAPLSGTAIYVISWGLFWFVQWSIYNIIGNALWITLAFYLGRFRWVRATKWILWEQATTMVIELSNKLADYKNLIITRIIFFPLEDLINFAWWISKIRFIPFLLISLTVTSIVGTARVYLGDIFF